MFILQTPNRRPASIEETVLRKEMRSSCHRFLFSQRSRSAPRSCSIPGVFSESGSGTLTRKYVTLFWIGLACDTTGTLMMSSMAAQTAGSMGVHGITGVVAIVLMLIHATWATWTYLRGSEQAQKRFHTFSTVVWLAWLIPYIIGILMGIPAIHLKAVCAAGTSVIVVALLSVILALPRHRRYQ